MNSAFSYFGGKARMVPWIVEHFPPKMGMYIEPFCGSAAVFFAAPGRWAPTEVLNDLNGDLFTFFRVLRDQPEELIERLQFTPHSRQEYRQDYLSLRSGEFKDDIDRALCFFVTCEQSFSGTAVKNGGQNSWTLPTPVENESSIWSRKCDRQRLLRISRRLKDASLENYPALKIIRLYDNEDTLFYVDPPYLATHSKESANYHGYMMSEANHAELVETLINVKGMSIVSGYNHPIYDRLVQNGWEKVCQKTTTPINNGKRIKKSIERTEILWISPTLQARRAQLRIFQY